MSDDDAVIQAPADPALRLPQQCWSVQVCPLFDVHPSLDRPMTMYQDPLVHPLEVAMLVQQHRALLELVFHQLVNHGQLANRRKEWRRFIAIDPKEGIEKVYSIVPKEGMEKACIAIVPKDEMEKVCIAIVPKEGMGKVYSHCP
ncbi:hypothetical protein ACOMHN_024166 [Nucella lapillus]